MLTTLRTGSQVDPGLVLPQAAALTMVTGAPVELLLALSRPHSLEVQAVAAAPTRFAWVDGGQAGVLLYRLGPVLPWAQVPFHPHLMAAGAGEAGVDRGPAVRIVLVDRDTRTIRAVHQVRWPETFAAVVRASVERMAGTPFHRLGHEHAVAALHRRYPTPDDLIIDRADAVCTAAGAPL